jgi:hypothetical protein
LDGTRLPHSGARMHVSSMSIFELATLAMILVGFLGLIIYVANHARSDDR